MIDTHAHIHSSDYPLPTQEVLARARQGGLTGILCVGTDVEDSRAATEFVASQPDCWATVGIHPHEAAKEQGRLAELVELARQPRAVAVGECGLDYYYEHSPRDTQKAVLQAQLDLARESNLPLILHVRGSEALPTDAFDDLWAMLDGQPKIKGVVHSFTSGRDELSRVLSYGLSVGVNGIVTFNSAGEVQEMARAIPLSALLLETDAPFLTPTPKRGKINEPVNVWETARFLADLRGEDPEALVAAATANAQALFGLKA